MQSAIAAAARLLPRDLPSPPSCKKVNPADSPILYLALISPTLRLSDVNEYADTLLAQRISTTPGIAQVSIFGAQKFAIRAQVDPRELATRGVGVDEVVKAIQDANVNLPTGTLYGPTVLGFSVDNFSLLALTLATGFVVDDRHSPPPAARP